MATIEKRKSGEGFRYRVSIRLKGFSGQSASFDTQDEAELWAKQIEDALLDARKEGYRPSFTYKFHEIASKYKQEHLSTLSPSESHKREQQIDFWEKEFGNEKINEITPRMIENVLHKLSKTVSIRNKKPLSPNTLQRKLAAISHIFTLCVIRWKVLEKNPLLLVEKPAGKNCKRSISREEVTADEVFFWLREHGIGDNEIERIKCHLRM